MPASAATLGRVALIVLLIAFEASVAVLALNPQVPERFRAFFIERTTDCWPIEVSGHYTLGEKVSFMPGAPGTRDLTVCGWSQPTVEGTWAQGPEARLRFAVDPPKVPLNLELEILGFVTVKQLVQRIVVNVNGRALTTLVLQNGTPGRQIIRIPPAVAALGNGKIEVTFLFPDAVTPQSQGLGSDRRRLAARLLSVRLAPAPPLDLATLALIPYKPAA